MNFVGVPDLLTAGQSSRTLTRVNQDLARVTQELSSGLRSDLVQASGGDPTRLYSIESELRLSEVRQFAVSQAKGRSAVTQSALERIQATLGDFGAPLLSAVTLNDLQAAETISSSARGAFSEVVSAVNSRFGDRSLFAGAATDGPALADADAILGDVSALIAGAADAGEVLTAIETYFSDPAGFQANGFLGSAVDAPDVELDDGEFVSYAVRADDVEISEVLSTLAIAVIGSEGGFAGENVEERQLLLGAASRRSITASDQIVGLRGELGVAEERFEEASVRLRAEEDMLRQARSSIVARDPFEAAIELSAIETQVQAIFSITARLSTLTLTNFLR